MNAHTNLRNRLDHIKEHRNGLFYMGAALNLYSEVMRREHDRILYGPDDVVNILAIVHILLSVTEDQTPMVPSRDPHATEEEVEKINDPFSMIEEAVKEPKMKRIIP